jgi:hypothetical protein
MPATTKTIVDVTIVDLKGAFERSDTNDHAAER